MKFLRTVKNGSDAALLHAAVIFSVLSTRLATFQLIIAAKRTPVIKGSNTPNPSQHLAFLDILHSARCNVLFYRQPGANLRITRKVCGGASLVNDRLGGDRGRDAGEQDEEFHGYVFLERIDLTAVLSLLSTPF